MRSSHSPEGVTRLSARADESLVTVHAAVPGDITLNDIHHLLTELLEKIATHKAKKAISVRDVMKMTGFSRSHLYAMGNPKCDSFQPAFPRAFRTGNVTRYFEHEISAWLEAQASVSRETH
ncbi:helix-turn-helix transcriptional regulator [Dyella humi]|uniref:AlpA family phage regulatory protein n=1 Tax=Dyella humi TaxID=1770547 RepID=A0ABW8IM59_9GAMM